ncbi:cytochrome c [Anaerolineae bacterium CFX9]|nr:cytochrome c [Anaerolineae bacterium CFX9]
MLQRLLVEKIEHRIIVGTVAFLGIMVLVGWLAINEGGRMQAFERQFLARSIERGAALFSSNCTSCHGTDGRGLVGIAPALNSPLLFGHDFLGEINRERSALNTELNAADLTEERRAEIEARLSELDTEEQGIRSQMQAAIDKGYDPSVPNRLNEVGWGGGLHSFVYTTLVSGRPVSSAYWPQPMAAWSQTAGGPLRPDQLEDLTNYILNWDKGNNWTIEDLLAVNQFPIAPVDPSTVVMTGGDPVIGADTELSVIMEGLAEVTGDPQAGMTLYNGSLACMGCHMNAAVAPVLEGTWTRVQEERLTLPQFADYTGEMYLVESITHPNDYIVPGYPANVMPSNFGNRLTYQQLADLVEYLKSQDQPN